MEAGGRFCLGFGVFGFYLHRRAIWGTRFSNGRFVRSRVVAGAGYSNLRVPVFS